MPGTFTRIEKRCSPGSVSTLTASSDDLATFIRGNDEAKVFDIPFGPFERRL